MTKKLRAWLVIKGKLQDVEKLLGKIEVETDAKFEIELRTATKSLEDVFIELTQEGGKE